MGARPMPLNIARTFGSRNALANKVPDADKIPDPPVTRPEPPEYLCDEARAVFREMCGHLAELRVMSDMDVAALALYSETFVTWKRAKDDVNETGLTVDSDKGSKPNPTVAIAAAAQTQLVIMLREFGLTPAARVKIRSGG